MNSPLIEYFPLTTHITAYTFYAMLFDGEPEARDGYVELSDRPGLGISLNEAGLEKYAVVPGEG
jgi:L-lyxonate dehydratase